MPGIGIGFFVSDNGDAGCNRSEIRCSAPPRPVGAPPLEGHGGGPGGSWPNRRLKWWGAGKKFWPERMLRISATASGGFKWGKFSGKVFVGPKIATSRLYADCPGVGGLAIGVYRLRQPAAD